MAKSYIRNGTAGETLKIFIGTTELVKKNYISLQKVLTHD